MPKFSQSDTEFMARAIELAKRGTMTTKPNPRVGCVVVDADKEILAGAWHQKAGEPHAERLALKQVSDSVGADACRGATAYVTLEPCSHYGRTGPCADALIEAGIGRVVVAMLDPNPLVSGNGVRKLKEAGIIVDVGLLENSAKELNRGFVARMLNKRPYVVVKMAVSIDGRTAMSSGESKWITGPDARQDVQRLRARSSAIVTGVGTIKHDNPSLRVRFEELGFASPDLSSEGLKETVQPERVILDPDAKLGGHEQVFGPPGNVVHVSAKGSQLGAELSAKLQEEHAEGIQLDRAAGGGLKLGQLLETLASREYNEVLVEAGAKLAGSFVAGGFADELHIYMASKILGSSARPLLDLPLSNMDEAIQMKLYDTRMLGEDLRLCYKLISNS